MSSQDNIVESTEFFNAESSENEVITEGYNVEDVKQVISGQNYPQCHVAAFVGDISIAIKSLEEDQEDYPGFIENIGTPLQIAASSPPYYRLITYFCQNGANAEEELTTLLEDPLIQVATYMPSIFEDEEEYLMHFKLNIIRLEIIRLMSSYLTGNIVFDELRAALEDLQEARGQLQKQHPKLQTDSFSTSKLSTLEATVSQLFHEHMNLNDTEEQESI